MRWFRAVGLRGGALWVAVLVLALVGWSGCGGEHEDAAGDTGRLPVYVVADPEGDWGFPNPYAHYERGPGYVRMSLIFDTLLWKDAEGIIPALAASWAYDEQAQSYTFELRDDVAWHDGVPFTADDVVFTFEYMREHPFYISDTSIVESVTADGNEVTFTLARPYAPFLEWVAGSVPILPQHIWRDVDRPEDLRTPESAVGTGPFKFGDYNREQGSYLYLANDEYYGGEVKVGELRFVKVAEEMIGTALAAGEVNAGSIRPEMAEGFEKDGFKVLPSRYWSTTKLMINHKKAPLNEKKVRQALAYAVDRAEIVEIARKGRAEPGSAGYIPPNSPWFAPEAEQYAYDPTRAAALLEERDNDKPLTLELIYSAGTGGNDQTRDAELLKRQLEQVGFEINLRNMEAKSRDDRVLKWDFDLALNSHGGLGGDPAQFNLVVLRQSFNSTRYEDNAELITLLEQQVGIMDADRRLEAVRRAQELFAEEMPSLTLYYPTNYFAHDGKVDLYFTAGGIGSGTPNAVNRVAFVND